MVKKIGIIITSHGQYCYGAIDSLNMIIGRSEDIELIAVNPASSIQEIEGAMDEAYEKLSGNCSDILIFTDLFYGTPNHIAVKMMTQKTNITIVTGYNLAILVELINRRNNGCNDIATLLRDEEKIFAESNRILRKEG